MLSATSRSACRRLGRQALLGLSTQCRLFSSLKEHIVVALGGNAMLKRGEDMTIANQRNNIYAGMKNLAEVVNSNSTTIVHGNGPQVGLLMLESDAYEKQTGLAQISLDVLDAETEGMLGYLIEQELQPHLKGGRGMATILSQIVCDPNDPSMKNPTKFVGPIYTKEEAEKLSVPVKADGDAFRRVVPSPLPIRLVPHQMEAVKQLTDADCVVICAGGGGIPVIEDPETGKFKGIEAVIDKDRAATMIGCALNAKGLLILTDVPAISTDFGKPEARLIKTVTPHKLLSLMDHFPAGSMGPKVEAATNFVNNTGGWAAIGSLNEATMIMKGQAGTMIRNNPSEDFIEFYEQGPGKVTKIA